MEVKKKLNWISGYCFFFSHRCVIKAKCSIRLVKSQPHFELSFVGICNFSSGWMQKIMLRMHKNLWSIDVICLHACQSGILHKVGGLDKWLINRWSHNLSWWLWGLLLFVKWYFANRLMAFLCFYFFSGASDDLKSPSARLVMGGLVSVGGGVFDLLQPLKWLMHH